MEERLIYHSKLKLAWNLIILMQGLDFRFSNSNISLSLFLSTCKQNTDLVPGEVKLGT